MTKLTAAARKHIKPSNFAEPGKKKYPIEDLAHARNALSRVAANGTAAEQAEVRAKVHKKYPGMAKRTAPKLTKKHISKGH